MKDTEYLFWVKVAMKKIHLPTELATYLFLSFQVYLGLKDDSFELSFFLPHLTMPFINAFSKSMPLLLSLLSLLLQQLPYFASSLLCFSHFSLDFCAPGLLLVKFEL
jgi:hypothetical protein